MDQKKTLAQMVLNAIKDLPEDKQVEVLKGFVSLGLKRMSPEKLAQMRIDIVSHPAGDGPLFRAIVEMI